MSRLRVIEGGTDYAEELVRNLREPDRQECEMFGPDVLGCVRGSFAASLASAVALDPAGRVVAAWGLVPVTAGVAQAWCLTTGLLEVNAREFARRSKLWMDAARRQWRLIEAYTDPRYEAAMRWCEFLGFTADPITWKDEQTGVEVGMMTPLGYLLARFWMTPP